MTDQSRSNRKKTSVNWWKWAFLGLVVLLAFFLFQIRGAFQTASIHEPSTDPVSYSKEEMVFAASASRQDTEQLINTFLTAVLAKEDTQVSVALNHQLEVHGKLVVFRLSVPFTLSFDPYVLENGNVQLQAVSVELGTLSLPIGATMNLLASQVEVPDFIAIDSAAEKITINLDELSKKQEIGVEMVQINLPEDEIRMNLRVDETVIIQNFDNESLNLKKENQ